MELPLLYTCELFICCSQFLSPLDVIQVDCIFMIVVGSMCCFSKADILKINILCLPLNSFLREANCVAVHVTATFRRKTRAMRCGRLTYQKKLKTECGKLIMHTTRAHGKTRQDTQQACLLCSIHPKKFKVFWGCNDFSLFAPSTTGNLMTIMLLFSSSSDSI